MNRVDLSKYSSRPYKPGSIVKRILWYIVSLFFFRTGWPFPNCFKSFMLSVFGGKIGKHINIKPGVNIKYPWFLELGDYVWLGEGVWIDNLGPVKIGNNVCISQEAYVFTGNHNYKSESFKLIIRGIDIEDGVWVGARAVICPGVRLQSHAVIAAGSVMNRDAQPFSIYQGNPAQIIKDRLVDKQ